MTAKPQQPKSEEEICTWGDYLGMTLCVVVVCLALYGAYAIGAEIIMPWAKVLFAKREQPSPAAERSAGELVDEAIAIPGAIVLSSHEDLIKKGIITFESGYEGTKVYFCSPTIAVKTRKNWCAWELANECMFRAETGGFTYPTNIDAHGIGGATSSIGFAAAFDDFKHCVDEGNRPDLIDPRKYGDICDERAEQNGVPYCAKFHHPILKPPVYDETIMHINSGACPKATYWTLADKQEADPSAFVMCQDGKPDPLEPLAGEK